MEETIDGTIPLPRTMATHGEVKMTRTDVMKIVGQLFKLKMNVNLISNVLGECATEMKVISQMIRHANLWE